MEVDTKAKRVFGTICATICLSCLLVSSAFAATVSGADHHGSGSTIESGMVDVLNVDGNAGETVFLTVKKGDTVIARNLAYTIGESAAEGDNTLWAGMATLDINDLDLNALDGSYSIEAYADREGKKPLYSGALYGVYADLPDNTSQLIGTRVANETELAARTFEPTETLYVNGRTYRLEGAAENQGGALHFKYVEYNEATSVDGVIKYTNAAGETVASTTIPGLAYGEERTVSIPAVVTTKDGDVYRTVFFKNSVVAKNPGQTSFSIYCTKMSDAQAALAGYYVATIQMVDENGNVIATDSVDVTGDFVYTAPASIYKNEVVNGEPVVVTYNIEGSPVIRMSAANDGVLNRERTITVKYVTQPIESNQVNVTYNLIDGSKRMGDTNRMLGTQSLVADESNQTVTPVSEIEADGVKYTLVGDASDYAFTVRKGMVPTINAYYVPEGHKEQGAYDVTVNYVNFLTGDVVESHTYVSDTEANAKILIDTPAKFSADSVDYVRLAGQEDEIQHSYYSGISTYTVYYRDVNDTLTSGTVINTIRVVYVDGTTAGGSATNSNGVVIYTGDEGTGDANTLQLNASRTYNVLDGEGNNSSLTNESGVNSNTERIAENETPLASGINQANVNGLAANQGGVPAWLLPVGIVVAIALIVLIAFLAYKNRRNTQTH